MKNYEKKYKDAFKQAKAIYLGNSYKPDIAATIAEILQNIFPELKEYNEDQNNIQQFIRALSSMTNVERQEWGD